MCRGHLSIQPVQHTLLRNKNPVILLWVEIPLLSSLRPVWQQDWYSQILPLRLSGLGWVGRLAFGGEDHEGEAPWLFLATRELVGPGKAKSWRDAEMRVGTKTVLCSCVPEPKRARAQSFFYLLRLLYYFLTFNLVWGRFLTSSLGPRLVRQNISLSPNVLRFDDLGTSVCRCETGHWRFVFELLDGGLGSETQGVNGTEVQWKPGKGYFAISEVGLGLSFEANWSPWKV